tara:strand:+ start:131 stop:673 length:543 start_codon:yes stop_codon:yes gene_type:complete
MTLNIGDKAVDYSLRNANEEIGGQSLTLEQSAKENGLVVVFECNHCPYVVASVDRMNRMSEYCKSNQIGFIGINSNDASVYANDSFEHMVKRARNGMPYAYLYDESQEIAHAYGAKRTPEFFLFDNNNTLVYRGRMDDSPRDPNQASTSELKDAIDAMLDGSMPNVSETESIGCSVKWKA